MRKTKIEIKTNIAVYANAYKATQLAANNWCNKTTSMADSNREAEIDFTNIELAEFGVHTVMSLADSVCKTCRKLAIDDFIK